MVTVLSFSLIMCMNLKRIAIENESYLQFFYLKCGLDFVKTRDSKMNIIVKIKEYFLKNSVIYKRKN